MNNSIKKLAIFTIFAIVSIMLISCTKQTSNQNNEPLYNQTLNNQLDDLTNPNTETGFVEFYKNFTKSPNAKYDFANDDILSLEQDKFNSSNYAVLGIKLGESYTDVINKLGQPDVMYVASDRSYRNMEYSKKIGIGDDMTAVTYHVDGDLVTSISMRQSFAQYLTGNTSIGTAKEDLYRNIGVPNYQDFTESQRVFHYIEKGVDFYINKDKVEIISIYNPKKFKGVVYKTVLQEFSPGTYVNVTKAFLID